MLRTRSPVYSACAFLPRLACVRHAASVRSEPGSNSPIGSYWSLILLADFLLFDLANVIPAKRDHAGHSKYCEYYRIYFHGLLLSSLQRPELPAAHVRQRCSSQSPAPACFTSPGCPGFPPRSAARGGAFYSPAPPPSTSFFCPANFLPRAALRFPCPARGRGLLLLCPGGVNQLRFRPAVSCFRLRPAVLQPLRFRAGGARCTAGAARRQPE